MTTTSVERALARTRVNADHGHQMALRVKAGGTGLSIGGGPMGDYQGMKDQAAARHRYGLFRGWVHAAVHAIAEKAAGQNVKLTRKLEEGSPKNEKGRKPKKRKPKEGVKDDEPKILTDHPILDMLQKPNPVQYDYQFAYSYVANLALTGWAYLVADIDEDGKPIVYSLPSTWVRPDHKEGPFSRFKVQDPSQPGTGEGDDKWLTREQVAFAHLPDPSNPMGAMSPAMAQLTAVKIDDKIQTSQLAFFDNGIFPSVIVSVGKDPHPDVPGGLRPRLTAAQRRQVYSAIHKVSGGVANYGNPAIVDGLIEKIERVSATQNEMGWDKSEQTVRTRILSAFGVHPFILGEEMAGSYAQAFIVREQFAGKVNVYLRLLSRVMTDFVPQLFDVADRGFGITYEDVVPVDPSLENQKMTTARARGDITQNEYRAFINMPPDEDKNPTHYTKEAIGSIMGVAASVAEGKITPEQGQAILIGFGLPDELAKDIAGEAPPEPPPGEAPGEMPPGAEGTPPGIEGAEEDAQDPTKPGVQDMGPPKQPKKPVGKPGGKPTKEDAQLDADIAEAVKALEME